jgi:Secretion system C-terminal sorting domain
MKKIQTILACLLVVSQLFSQQLAFPTAEGGGRFARGGRGGTVYEVTNLNDAGAGSLRDAVSVGNRTVVFRVSGEIKLQSRLTIRQSNITIAGQTAPGDGICITGNTLNIQASDIIIRYIRCRLGDANPVEDDAMNSWSGNFQNIIIDHCSMSWSIDETGSFYDIKNFTLQWCILSESLYNSIHNKGLHGYAGIWGGLYGSYHHNLLAHHTSRAPRFQGTRYKTQVFPDSVDFRNNVIYNWGNINSAYGGENGVYNMVNNYYKAGPATGGSLTASSTSNKRNRIFNYTSYFLDGVDTVRGGKFYIAGNYVDGFPDVTADNWTRGVQKDSYWNANALIAANKLANPVNLPPLSTQTALEAYQSVLADAGATLPCRDTVDRRIVRETRTGTATFEGATYGAVNGTGISHPSGIIDRVANVGGMPVYNSTPPPLDTDKDGMPDAWENAKLGLSATNPNDRNTITTSGYTELEVYLNSITSTCGTRVGISEKTPPPLFSLSPNPANNFLTLQHPNLEGNAVFSIYDVSGKKWLSQKANGTTTTLNIESLACGVYLVECQNEVGKSFVKFVKQ